jgi:hypothetical protein
MMGVAEGQHILRREERRRAERRTDLVLSLDERVEKLVGVNDGLSVVGHETDDAGVPSEKESGSKISNPDTDERRGGKRGAHLLTILEKVVEPDDMRTCRIRLLNC